MRTVAIPCVLLQSAKFRIANMRVFDLGYKSGTHTHTQHLTLSRQTALSRVLLHTTTPTPHMRQH